MAEKPLTISEIAERLKALIEQLESLLETPKEETK
jgi:hypothetical protein